MTRSMWIKYGTATYRSGYVQGTRLSLPAEAPFKKWHVSQRYAHRSIFDRDRAELHQQGAQTVRSLVNQAILEGIVI